MFRAIIFFENLHFFYEVKAVYVEQTIIQSILTKWGRKTNGI